MSEQKKKTFSYSELKNWDFCPHYRKLIKDRVNPFNDSVYTVFGTAIHLACEEKLKDPKKNCDDIFIKKYKELIVEKEILTREEDEEELKKLKKLVKECEGVGVGMADEALKELKKTFGKFTLDSTEFRLKEDIENYADFKFKGLVDLVIKTDDIYHIIDWKSCGWGWDSRKKNDKMNAYQLVLYKHFFAEKFNIDPKKIKVYYGLLKRTGKCGKRVELVPTTSGPQRTKNALNLMNKALHNISKENHIKNRLSCELTIKVGKGSYIRTCNFRKTEHCT